MGETSQFASAVRFPGEDGGDSLAQMAQRDLDAALQLLADRAQYITEANGAAIALRRRGKNDMLCRASTGSNAPELGALLSAEFGLSGESVRTRKALRCDDAERDPRVNREVCRQLGIASVVVMPVVNDDEVLGVFELFSGKAHAFNERDLSALERLSGMVETAVKLAHAAESLPERLRMREVPAPRNPSPMSVAEFDPVLEIEPEPMMEPPPAIVAPVLSAPILEPPVERVAPALSPKKPLFWSAMPANDVQKIATPDQSHVPPVLRNLSKCEACGFPVSTGRVLCVDCEEKKWRGQLKVPAVGSRPAPPAASPAVAPAVRPMAVVAQSGAAAAAAMAPSPRLVQGLATVTTKASVPSQPALAPKEIAVQQLTAAPVTAATNSASEATASENPPTDVVFSAGLEPSQSWISRNKYVFGAILVVGVIVAAILLFR